MELIDLVKRRGVPRVDLFDLSKEKEQRSHLYKLYNAMASNKFKDDNSLARHVYGTDASSKKYLMLKSRLKDKLLNNLFFMENDPKRHSERDMENLRANRIFYCSKILLVNGVRQLGIQNMERIVKKAERYHFTEVGLACALNIRYHYSLVANKAKAAHYDKMALLFERQYNLENSSARVYEKLIGGYAKRNYDKKVLNEAEKYLQVIEKSADKDITFNAQMHIFRIKNIYYVINDHYDNCIKACEALEKYILKNKDFYSHARMAEIGHNLLSVYVDTNAVAEARLALKKYLDFNEEYTFNWYLFMDKYVHLCILTANYNEASELLRELSELESYDTLHSRILEKFRIYNAFLYFVDSQLASSKKFNTWKFLNEVPIVSKDKLGYNVAILIAQIVIAVKDKDYDLVSKRNDAILAYSYRHLNKPANKRSQLFIKMLSKLEPASFDRKETEKATRHLLESLKSMRRPGMLYEDVIEVIPYEVLWESLLEYLE